MVGCKLSRVLDNHRHSGEFVTINKVTDIFINSKSALTESLCPHAFNDLCILGAHWRSILHTAFNLTDMPLVVLPQT
jgi:hypothetical protein